MSARDNILAKLRLANATPLKEPETAAYYQEMTPHWDSETERLKHWAAAMRAVKTEIYWVRADDWASTLLEVAQQKSLRNILLPLQTEHGQTAAAAVEAAGIEVKAFDRPIEDWKDEFFADIDAGFTDCRCGISHPGTWMRCRARTWRKVCPPMWCWYPGRRKPPTSSSPSPSVPTARAIWWCWQCCRNTSKPRI